MKNSIQSSTIAVSDLKSLRNVWYIKIETCLCCELHSDTFPSTTTHTDCIAERIHVSTLPMHRVCFRPKTLGSLPDWQNICQIWLAVTEVGRVIVLTTFFGPLSLGMGGPRCFTDSTFFLKLTFLLQTTPPPSLFPPCLGPGEALPRASAPSLAQQASWRCAQVQPQPLPCAVGGKKMIWSVRQTDRESGECILPPPLPLKEPIKQGQCTIEWKERQRERQGWRCLYQGMYRYITVSAPLRGSAGLRQYNDMCVVRRFRLGRTQGECSYRDWGSDQITVTEIKTSWANTGQSDILTKNSGKWDVSFCVLLDL